MANMRETIMSECPEEFQSDLSSFIDEIESDLKDIESDLEYVSNILDAKTKLSALTKSLY